MRLADLERVGGARSQLRKANRTIPRFWRRSAARQTIHSRSSSTTEPLGVTVGFVQANQRPVGQLQWNANLASIYNSPGNVSGQRWATGTLLANNLFLTAGHNFDQSGGGWTRPLQNGTFNTISEIATNMHVNFNFQVDPNGVLRTEQQFRSWRWSNTVSADSTFRSVVWGNPAATFGTATVSTTDAVQGETICIMGHPRASPNASRRARSSAAAISCSTTTSIRWVEIQALEFFAPVTGVVGVHTNGGCNTAGTGQNRVPDRRHHCRIADTASAHRGDRPHC